MDMGLYTALVSSQGRAHIASETADKQLAPLAPAIRAHSDDDHVLILEANERFPEGIHPLGPPLEPRAATPSRRRGRVSGSRAPVHRQQPARDRAVASSSRRARCSHLRRYDFSGSSFCAPPCPYLWKAAVGLEGPEFPGMITEPLGRSGHGRPPGQQERLFVIIWRAGGPVRTSDVPGFFLLSLPCLVRAAISSATIRSCPPMPRCVARATKQLGRPGPTTTA